MMTKEKMKQFKIATDEAYMESAVASERFKADEGSCNLDSVDIYVGTKRDCEQCCEVLRELAMSPVICCSGRQYFVSMLSPWGGQGDKNTEAVKAMARVFNAYGFSAFVNYRID